MHLADVVAHPGTIGVVVLALFSWAALSGLWLWRGTNRLVRSLTEATRAVERSPDERSFAADYDAVAEQLKNDLILGARWREYDDSLVARDKPVPHYRSTTRAATWFDTGLLRVPAIGIDPRYHAALPNLLVGAGLLFTFVGLAFALNSASGVVSGEPCPMIRTQSVHSPKDRNKDGIRILATRVRGRGLRANRYDVWMANLAPSEALLNARRNNLISWDEFSRRYRKELKEGGSIDKRNRNIKNHGQKFTLRLIQALGRRQNVTLMCHCDEDQKQCHRHLLKKVLDSTIS